MLLYELLEIINECSVVTIVDNETLEELAIYDGTNSIDEKYNDANVWDILPSERIIAQGKRTIPEIRIYIGD